MADLRIENARVLFKNFSGKEKRNQNNKIVNREGARNFNIVIDDPEIAEQLRADGWDIKQTSVNDEGESLYRLPVHIRFDNFPPQVVMVSGNKKKTLNEESISCLDNAEIDYCDVCLNPYHYEVQDKTGIKAYLKMAYFVINVDPWEEKYAMMECPEE